MASTKKNTNLRKDIEETIYDAADSVQEKAELTVDYLIDKLKYERDKLDRELRHEYRNARRYVRKNPEQGVGAAFVAGLVIGVLLSRSGRN